MLRKSLLLQEFVRVLKLLSTGRKNTLINGIMCTQAFNKISSESTERIQEYDSKLHKKFKFHTNKATISTKPNASKESAIKMDLEVGGKNIPTKVIRTGDNKPQNRTHETGDVLPINSSETDSKRVASKQEHGSTGTKPKPIVAFPRYGGKLAKPRTKSKTELTRKELMSQECTQKQTERIQELKREEEENDENAEVLGIPLPFRSIGERSSMTDLHKLLEQCPQPQPPLINKQLKSLQLNADQALIMADHVKKMKTGMERLQEVIQKFNCTEKFKQDVDFILANVGPALAKSERMRESGQTAYTAQDDQITKK